MFEAYGLAFAQDSKIAPGYRRSEVVWVAPDVQRQVDRSAGVCNYMKERIARRQFRFPLLNFVAEGSNLCARGIAEPAIDLIVGVIEQAWNLSVRLLLSTEQVGPKYVLVPRESFRFGRTAFAEYVVRVRALLGLLEHLFVVLLNSIILCLERIQEALELLTLHARRVRVGCSGEFCQERVRPLLPAQVCNPAIQRLRVEAAGRGLSRLYIPAVDPPGGEQIFAGIPS